MVFHAYNMFRLYRFTEKRAREKCTNLRNCCIQCTTRGLKKRKFSGAKSLTSKGNQGKLNIHNNNKKLALKKIVRILLKQFVDINAFNTPS